MRLLTIDWDYFINVPFEDRNDLYPKIQSGYIESHPDNSLWNNVDLSTTGFFQGDYEKLLDAIKKASFEACYLSENHARVMDIFKEIEPKTVDKVVNLDFHHDFYYSGSKLSCDNWGNFLKDICPQISFEWVKREDSITTTFGEVVPVRMVDLNDVIKDIALNKFQVIHLCRSDLYSPPIFDNKFTDLWYAMSKSSQRSFEIEGLKDRRICDE